MSTASYRLERLESDEIVSDLTTATERTVNPMSDKQHFPACNYKIGQANREDPSVPEV